MTLRNALHVLFVASCFAILVAPAITMVRPFFEEPVLAGWVPPLKRPEPTLVSVGDESFQRGFVAWFEQQYGLRPTATRIDESIAYWGFGEVPPDKRVIIGTRDVLFLDDHLLLYNSAGGGPDVDVFARALVSAQAVMLARGQVLLYIVVPGKLTVWPDDMPKRWSLPQPEPRPYLSVTPPLVDALKRAGARFVDGRRTLAELSRSQPEAVYAKTARHVSSPAMCMLLEEAFSLARPLLPMWKIPALDCSFTMRTDAPLESNDYDLYRLLNIWPARPRTPIAVVEQVAVRVPAAERPNMLVVGSSFGWPLVYEAERNHAVGEISFHYYMDTLYERRTGATDRVKMGSQRWLDTVSSSPLIVMPVPEEFLSRNIEELIGPLLRAFGPEHRAE
jgi:hypothetical protein